MPLAPLELSEFILRPLSTDPTQLLFSSVATVFENLTGRWPCRIRPGKDAAARQRAYAAVSVGSGRNPYPRRISSAWLNSSELPVNAGLFIPRCFARSI